jgi:hypothetical protein
MSSIRPASRLGVAFALVALTASVLAAPSSATEVASLGTPGPESAASPAPTPVTSESDSLLAYASCMRENGVEMDDPRFDATGALIGGLGKDAGSGIDSKSEIFLVAQQICGETLAALKPAVDPEVEAEQMELLLDYAACMRGQGIDLPDPGLDGTKFAAAAARSDTASDKFIAADIVCGDAFGSKATK